VDSRHLKGVLAVLVAAFAALLTSATAQAAPTDFAPLATHKSPFNCGKTFYANNWTPNHRPAGAIDWQSYGGDATNGETVRATAGGTARFYSTLSRDDMGVLAYGNNVVVTHPDGTKTRYAHLATMVGGVGTSRSVSQGTPIGTVGGTGGVDPHLHYEQITASGGLDTSPTVEGTTVPLGRKIAIRSTNACGGGGNPYTPQEVCGSGYSVIDQAALTGGTVYLLYNSGNGYNCVTTLKSTNLGTPSAVSSFLEPQGGTRTTDSGNFAYYAGPVAKHAPNVCVRWGGSVGSSSYTSPFEHCG
jgi:hypothetical protein